MNYQKHPFEDMLYSSKRGDNEIWFIKEEYDILLDKYHASLPPPFNQDLP